MAASSSVILLIVAGSFLGAAYGGDKLYVPPAQDISSFTFQLRTIYGNTTLSNKTLDNGVIGDGEGPRLMEQLPDADENLYIYALPVGQGDCTVIQCPIADGNKISIIDAGSRTEGIGFNRQELVNFLRLRERDERGANRVTIQSIFLTHPDMDHINYIDDILNAYGRNVPLYHSCHWRTYRRRVESPFAQHQRVNRCCGDCQEYVICPNSHANLRVIASEHNRCVGRHKNGDSIVSTIEYGGKKTLITGDFEGGRRFMQRFFQCAGDLLRADIYRLSHHGAANGIANRTEFLQAINARYVFSSSGFLHGHPRCELYNYYVTQRDEAPEEQQLAAAEEHYYTCQSWIGRRNYQRVTHEPARAIYVTTVNDGGIRLHNINYVIQFKINNEGGIESSAWRVRV